MAAPASASALAPAAPAAVQAGLHVIPFPGTPDASPLSRIVFSSILPSDIQSINVTGSSSGAHTGQLTTLPDGAGAAFIPRSPFTPGETVTVDAMLASTSAAIASGQPTGDALNFSFTVGVATGGPTGGKPQGLGPTQRFRSAPFLRPPVVTASSDPDRSSGDIFLTPEFAPEDGPMIIDGQGRLIWFQPVPALATNLEVQSYHGSPVLTWWQGKSSSSGEDMIVGRSYRTIAVIRAGDGYTADVHEFQLTPSGTALIDAYVPVVADLSSIGGSSTGRLMDCAIQELDVKTGQVLWEWHALGHVPLSASHSGAPVSSTPYDFFHINSIQQLANGNLLISARNTWAVYEIDKQTGNVIWSLGGKSSSFKMGSGTSFEWQHDARLYPNGTLSLFDDAALPQEERQSSAKVLALNTSTMTASLVHRYTHMTPLLSSSAGNAQILPDHNVFVGWGRQPDFSEYTRSGKQIFNGDFTYGVRSYRAYRFAWTAQPSTPPSIAEAARSGGGLNVYASWNGATQVASWRVLGGASPGSLRYLATVARSGFETTIAVSSRPRYVAVQALNTHGKVLGASEKLAVTR